MTQKRNELPIGGVVGPSSEDFWDMLIREKVDLGHPNPKEWNLSSLQVWLGEKFSLYCCDSYRRTYLVDLHFFKVWYESKFSEWQKMRGAEYHIPDQLCSLAMDMSSGKWPVNQERPVELATLTDEAYRIVAEKVLPPVFAKDEFAAVLGSYLIDSSPFKQRAQLLLS